MNIKYEHPTIVLTQPCPGHYVIAGHNPAAVTTDKGAVVPIETCYITPEVPSEILFGILQERDFDPNPFGPTDEELRAVMTENDALATKLDAVTKERDAALEQLTAPKDVKGAKK